MNKTLVVMSILGSIFLSGVVVGKPHHMSLVEIVAGVEGTQVSLKQIAEMQVENPVYVVDYCGIKAAMPAEYWGVVYTLGRSCGTLTWLMYVAQHESTWNPYATNWEGSGATGLLQYMPDTWNRQCYGDIWNAADQLRCGAKDIDEGMIRQWAVIKF